MGSLRKLFLREMFRRNTFEMFVWNEIGLSRKSGFQKPTDE